jgi:hypothetical protein
MIDDKLNTYCYISEQVSYPEDNKDFGYTVHDKGNRFYLTFKSVLQSFNTLNRNRRIYLAENIMNQINNSEYIQEMLRKNSWIGELDHPAPEKNGEELAMNRIANPSMEKSSHFIRKPRLVGNYLEADIQTDSSTNNGMNLAIKVVDGKITPSFSARVLGELTNQGGRPTVNVKKLITYDCVLFPSHKEASAYIKQPIIESVNELENYTNSKVVFLKDLAKEVANKSKETEILCETFGLSIDDVIGLSTDGSVIIQENKNLFKQPLMQKDIRNKTKSMITDWLK